MTTSSTDTVTASVASQKPATFAERMVLGLLEKMPQGGLRLYHADGRQRDFGEVGAPISAEVRINNDDEFFKRCAFYGNVGMGEAYTDGIWDTSDIKAVVTWFIDNMAALQGDRSNSSRLPKVNLLKMVNWVRHLKRSNTIETSRRNISEHYDLGNTFYQEWLDGTMTYSCAMFDKTDESFEAAQNAKYEALCQKLQLKKGEHVLEIGCGWGGFCAYAAKNYGVKITALTISQAQADFARERMKREGLENLVEIRIQDYRLVEGEFDKIVSIEMLEAVGDKFHESFFGKCHEVMKPAGLLAVQMITVPDSRYKNLKTGVDWIQRHIFPGSLLLSVGRVNEVLQKTGNLFMHDLEDMGTNYVRTLDSWHQRFNGSKEKLNALGYDESFFRTWNYYLKYCEAAFATRNISVVQAVYTRPNNSTLQRSLSELSA
ncbi:MAG: class I SAM-dependent methyltransferase [Roseibacillus sp.]